MSDKCGLSRFMPFKAVAEYYVHNRAYLAPQFIIINTPRPRADCIRDVELKGLHGRGLVLTEGIPDGLATGFPEGGTEGFTCAHRFPNIITTIRLRT